MNAAEREFEERRAELRESLIAELEEKRRALESERPDRIDRPDRSDMLTDPAETRGGNYIKKLRRRPNEPRAPPPEKRRRPSPSNSMLGFYSVMNLLIDLIILRYYDL